MPKGKVMRHASALKALRKSLVRRDQNTQLKSKVRTLTNRVLKSIQDKNVDAAKSQFILAQSAWQKAAKRGVFHTNVASRKISRMASGISSISKS